MSKPESGSALDRLIDAAIANSTRPEMALTSDFALVEHIEQASSARKAIIDKTDGPGVAKFAAEVEELRKVPLDPQLRAGITSVYDLADRLEETMWTDQSILAEAKTLTQRHHRLALEAVLHNMALAEAADDVFAQVLRSLWRAGKYYPRSPVAGTLADAEALLYQMYSLEEAEMERFAGLFLGGPDGGDGAADGAGRQGGVR